MTHTYSIHGMTCNGCRATVEKLLLGVQGVQRVSVDLQKGEAIIEMDKHIPTTQLQSALKDHPLYTLNDKGKSGEVHEPTPPKIVLNVSLSNGSSEKWTGL